MSSFGDRGVRFQRFQEDFAASVVQAAYGGSGLSDRIPDRSTVVVSPGGEDQPRFNVGTGGLFLVNQHVSIACGMSSTAQPGSTRMRRLDS